MLVPGWKDDCAALHPLRHCLIDHGWNPEHVNALSFADPYGGNVQHSEEVAIAVGQLAETAQGLPVAIVAHSMGGLAVRWYLAHHLHKSVRTVITLATPHVGTWLAWFARGNGASDMRPGSSFLTSISRQSIPPGINFYCLRARFDTRLIPAGSAWLPGTRCMNLPAHGHKRILRHAAVCDRVIDILGNTGRAES